MFQPTAKILEILSFSLGLQNVPEPFKKLNGCRLTTQFGLHTHLHTFCIRALSIVSSPFFFISPFLFREDLQSHRSLLNSFISKSSIDRPHRREGALWLVTNYWVGFSPLICRPLEILPDHHLTTPELLIPLNVISTIAIDWRTLRSFLQYIVFWNFMSSHRDCSHIQRSHDVGCSWGTTELLFHYHG